MKLSGTAEGSGGWICIAFPRCSFLPGDFLAFLRVSATAAGTICVSSCVPAMPFNAYCPRGLISRLTGVVGVISSGIAHELKRRMDFMPTSPLLLMLPCVDIASEIGGWEPTEEIRESVGKVD